MSFRIPPESPHASPANNCLISHITSLPRQILDCPQITTPIPYVISTFLPVQDCFGSPWTPHNQPMPIDCFGSPWTQLLPHLVIIPWPSCPFTPPHHHTYTYRRSPHLCITFPLVQTQTPRLRIRNLSRTKVNTIFCSSTYGQLNLQGLSLTLKHMVILKQNMFSLVMPMCMGSIEAQKTKLEDVELCNYHWTRILNIGMLAYWMINGDDCEVEYRHKWYLRNGTS